MRNIIFLLFPVATLLSVFALPGNASLVGTSVTGSLTFAGGPSNYFDPGYGFVPASGYLNSSGTTVTISNSAVEFGYDDGSNLISADFSDNQFTISDRVETGGANNGFEMIFTDSAFSQQSLLRVSDSFPISSYSVAGNVITLDYAGGTPAVGQTLSATFGVSPSPEPSTLGYGSLTVLAGLAVFFARRR